MRVVRVLLLLLACGTAASPLLASDDVTPLACIPPVKCCRICTEGKACGKSCIDASKTCHKGRGCACNASEVCAEDP